MAHILVLEDDLALSAGLCFELDACGHLTVAAYHCEKARQLLEKEAFDLCREVKEKYPNLPVLFLTANDLEEDVLKGFDLGADDYITKPFRLPILKKRVEVALRRGTPQDKGDWQGYDDGFLRLDFTALTAVRGGEVLSITPNEYKLLRVLTSSPGTVVTRRLLLEKLWDKDGNFIDDHTLTVTVNRLRSKIEDGTHTYIKTVRGMGYIWTGAAA